MQINARYCEFASKKHREGVWTLHALQRRSPVQESADLTFYGLWKCGEYTAQNAWCTPITWIFSRGSRSSQGSGLCVSIKPSSHLARTFHSQSLSFLCLTSPAHSTCAPTSSLLISSWRAKKSVALRGKIWIIEAGMPSWESRRYICELQRQIQSDSMEIGNTHEESRRERAQLCEELSLQERAHQETRIRSIHDVEKLKRVQEMRVDELSRQDLTERQSELGERLLRIPACRISVQWKIIPRSQSTGGRSKPSWYAEPRPKHATWCMESAWYIGKRPSVYTFRCGNAVQPSSSAPVGSPLYGRHPVCIFDGSVFADGSTSRPVAGMKSEIETVFWVERKNFWLMVFSQISALVLCTCRTIWLIKDFRFRNSIFTSFPRFQTFSSWKIRFKTRESACSSSYSEAMLWIKEVEMVDLVDNLKSSHSSHGHHFQNFETLDARVASALNKIIHKLYFKKKVSLKERKAQKEDRFYRGRQVAYMMYDYFWVTGADLFTITLPSDDVQQLDTRWDEIVLSISKMSTDDVLESLHK